MEKQVILNAKHLELTLKRLCHELIETHNDFSETVIIGLQPRGIHVVQRVKEQLENILDKEITCGSLDITFYRDDFRRSNKVLQASTNEMDCVVEGRNVVFVDDVLYTGRSIRAALTAIQAYGRPSSIELLILIGCSVLLATLYSIPHFLVFAV